MAPVNCLPNAMLSGARLYARPLELKFGSSSCSQILGPQVGALCDPGQHAGADLFVVVEGEHEAIVDRLPLRAAIQVVAGGQRPLELG
jgi:hypothetical protein